MNDQKLDSNSTSAPPATPLTDVPTQADEAESTPSFVQRSQRFTKNPRHTQVTRDPSSTTGYFRMLLAALPARYGFRGIIDSLRSRDSAQWLQTRIDSTIGTVDAALQNPSDVTKKAAAIKTLEQNGVIHDAKGNLEKGIRYAKRAMQGIEFDHDNYREGVDTKIKNTILDTGYDNVLGLGSLAVTASYEKRVYDDMQDIFSEAVAYETGKSPDAIGMTDLRNSKNKIVDSTLNNFLGKTIVRFGTDLGFFGRQLSKIHPRLRTLNSIRFGDIMIGVKGGLLINEVMKKDTTIFVDLLGLIDNKVNPEKGLGESITSADIIDLYQKYSREHNPQAAFTDTTIYQQRDQMEWPQAEQLFLRVADLMNQTYMYKHSSLDDMARLESVTSPSVDFALPKLIYLLGNNMIDARKPEESYTYIEIAGKSGLGIEAVKEAKRMVDSGTDIHNVAKQFDIDLTPVEVVRGKDGTTQSYKEAKAQRIQGATTPPTPLVSADSAQREFLEQLNLQRS